MKKIICLLSLLLTLAFLAGCFSGGSSNERPGSGGAAAPNEGKEDEPTATEYTVEELSVYKGESKIYGKLYVPKNSEGKFPAVVLSHSAFLTEKSLRSYAAAFASRGYLAYAFDFCGGSSSGKSDGNVKDMTIFTEVDDLKAVLSAIRLRDDANQEEIYLFGTSQGGLVSALVAAEREEDVAGMILLYPAFNIAEQAKKYSSIVDFMGDLLPVGRAYIDTLLDYDPYEHIGDFEKEVLIIHGTADNEVAVSYSEKAAETYAHCTLEKIEGAGHGFNADNFSFGANRDEEVWRYIDEYLNLKQ